MRGSTRKVQPQQKHGKENNIDLEYDWSSDNETISSLAFALRKVIKSDISRILDKNEINSIEKRFEDTSKVIHKELETFNRSLLRKSYRRPMRSDIVAIEGRRIASPITGAPIFNDNGKQQERLNSPTGMAPTIENVWHRQKQTVREPPTSSQDGVLIKPSSKGLVGKNAVAPSPALVQNNDSRNSHRKGICRRQRVKFMENLDLEHGLAPNEKNLSHNVELERCELRYSLALQGLHGRGDGWH